MFKLYLLFKYQHICQPLWKTTLSRNEPFPMIYNYRAWKCSFKDIVCLKDEELQANSGLTLCCATN